LTSLLELYEDLIKKIANYYYKNTKVQHMDFEELVAEGQIGFIEAVRRFDIEKGYELSTFATYSVKNSILNAMRKSSIIKHSTRDIMNQMKKNKEGKSDKTTLYDIDLLDTSDKFECCMKYSSNTQHNLTLEDEFINMIEKKELECIVKKSFEVLTPSEKVIILNYFGFYNYEKINLKKISEKYGLDYINVRMMKKSGLQKIKKFILSNNNDLDLCNIN